MLVAFSFLCVFLFKFKVSFLTFDFKDAFLAVIGFLYGPLYAVASAILVAIFEFISVSDTGIYGLIMNALSSAAFSGVCGLFYKYKRSFSGAVTGAVCAIFSMTVIMLIANIFITPFYMGVARSDVASMIPTLLLPFNLIKGTVNVALTLVIYKPITTALRKAKLLNVQNQKIDFKKSLILTACALLTALISIIIIFVFFKATFEI